MTGLPGTNRRAQSALQFYYEMYERVTGQLVSSNPKLNAFGCYRNVPCHQACFYERELLLRHPFQLEYRVRADYEQFLWCFFEAKANPFYTGITVADYEGGGFSETKRKKSCRIEEEHREIVQKYMSFGQRFTLPADSMLTLRLLGPGFRRMKRQQHFITG